MAWSAAECVNFLALNGVIHRDIKPEVFILGDDEFNLFVLK